MCNSSCIFTGMMHDVYSHRQYMAVAPVSTALDDVLKDIANRKIIRFDRDVSV